MKTPTHREPVPHKCFAYSRDKKACNALSELLCVTRGKCSRFKTHAEFHEQEEAACERAAQRGYYITSKIYQPSEGTRHDAKKA